MTDYKIISMPKFLFFIPVFLIFLLPNVLHADQFMEVKDIRQWSHEGYTRVVIDLTGAVEFLQKRISEPDRLYFDLKNTKIAKDITTNMPVGDGILKTVRAGQFDKETVRVVLDLQEIKDFYAFILEDPAKLVIDVYGTEKPPKAPETTVPGIKPLKSVVTLVIDPGHGGHDPGAVGPKNLYEKDVVLDIALKLKKILSKNPNYKVYMTRDKDVFIPLVERTAFANGKNADLFISIHANASPRKAARGVETYLLNWTNDEEAIKVAARENNISLKSMKKYMDRYKKESYVAQMLNSLKRDIKRDKSVKLAGYVQKTIISTLDDRYSSIKDLGVKNALFYVLIGAQMPSVLAEVSFISNPVEEQLLRKEAYREHIAKALADGVESYIVSVPPDQKFARLK